MGEKINTGTILIKEGAVLPECLQLETEPYWKGWRLVKNLDGKELDRKIHKAGWTLFFMADEIEVTAIGFDLGNTMRRAVKKAIAYIKSDRFNTLEITEVAVKHFLGHCYVSVIAHPRHIQESMILFHTQDLRQADQIRLAAA